MENKKLLTLCIIHQENRVLLGMKKRGFGAGRWNGFGGKVEKGETIENATKREVAEEAGILVVGLEQMGILEFEFWSPTRRPPTDMAEDTLQVHIFKATTFSGDPIETEEMRPKWFAIKDIPYKDMWPDDIYWLPMFLEGKRFNGRFVFGEGDIILKHELHEV